MIKLSAILIVGLSLSGCSFLVELALFNNSGQDISVCNLNHSNKPCQTISNNAIGLVTLISNKAASNWSYSINDRVYNFNFGSYPEHVSNIYCSGFVQKRCAISIQYQNNGLLYWAGKNQELPVDNFPNQPEGFPVEPNA